MEPGEFKLKQARNRARQKLFDACKRAREGEEDVWVTIQDSYGGWVRAKLAPGDPKTADFEAYACDAGYGAILMVRGTPTLVRLEGKEGRVYLPTGAMFTGAFRKKVLGLVEKPEHVKRRSGD